MQLIYTRDGENLIPVSAILGSPGTSVRINFLMLSNSRETKSELETKKQRVNWVILLTQKKKNSRQTKSELDKMFHYSFRGKKQHRLIEGI